MLLSVFSGGGSVHFHHQVVAWTQAFFEALWKSGKTMSRRLKEHASNHLAVRNFISVILI